MTQNERRKILVLDDDPAILASLERLLRGSYVTSCHRTPDHAWNEIQISRPWACLVDLHLDGNSGIDFLRKLRVDSPQVLRVLISGDLSLPTLIQSLESGLVNKVVSKPWEPARLLIDLEELKQLEVTLAETERLKELARTDPLTGLLNKRFLYESLQAEIDRSQRTKNPFSFLMVDVDQFKSFNDLRGHLAGDAILCHLASHLKSSLRSFDLVFRYGGDEFAILLQETAATTAQEIAERLRNSFFQKTGQSISIGISSFPTDANSIATLIEAADQALYQAKSQGRNQSVVAGTPKRG